MSQNGNEDGGQRIDSNSPNQTKNRRTINNFIPKPPLHNAYNTTTNGSILNKPKTDYLKERRIKREQDIQSGAHLKDSWLKNLSNKKLSKKEKFIRIKEKAREIEELALRKEQLLNVKGASDNYGNMQSHSG